MGLFIFLKMINPIRKKSAPKAMGNNLSFRFDASKSFIRPWFLRYKTVTVGATVLKKKDKKNIRSRLSIVDIV